MILYFDLFLEDAIHTWFSLLAKLLSMGGSKKWTCCSWWAPRTPLKSFRTKPKRKVTVPSKTGCIMLIHFEGLRQHKITLIYLESIGVCRFSPLQPTQLERTDGRAQARVAAPCVPPLWTRSHGSFLKFAVENHHDGKSLKEVGHGFANGSINGGYLMVFGILRQLHILDIPFHSIDPTMVHLDLIYPSNAKTENSWRSKRVYLWTEMAVYGYNRYLLSYIPMISIYPILSYPILSYPILSCPIYLIYVSN